MYYCFKYGFYFGYIKFNRIFVISFQIRTKSYLSKSKMEKSNESYKKLNLTLKERGKLETGNFKSISETADLTDKKKYFWKLKTENKLKDKEIQRLLEVNKDTITRWNKVFKKGTLKLFLSLKHGGSRNTKSKFDDYYDDICRMIEDNPTVTRKQILENLICKNVISITYPSLCKFIDKHKLLESQNHNHIQDETNKPNIQPQH